ncbi:hydroxyacid dehydrogenase, partial [Xylella fastidiosa subsp. multiplex]|nr:hydroxyacid dehydrogenase [Xylella fastidiosa subsp. multiplex]
MSEPFRVVAAGDHFILPSLITAAIARELDCEVTELTLGWPLEP